MSQDLKMPDTGCSIDNCSGKVIPEEDPIIYVLNDGEYFVYIETRKEGYG